MKNRLAALALPALLMVLAPFANAQKVYPTVTGTGNASRYTLTMGLMTLQFGPKNSGRIHTLQYNGANILHMDTASATNYGSTFWPSPQAVWSWPPPAALDGTAFPATVNADSTVEMYGASETSKTNTRLRKKFWADLSDSSFNLRYTIVNVGAARPWSPWEDTRVDTGGVYLFPKGDGTITGDLANKTKDTNSVIWYQHIAANVPTGSCAGGACKFYADGKEGWYAHVRPNRTVFIKKFSDSPLAKKAPSPENEIELYATYAPITGADFVEMEAQGSYDTIKTNDSVSWDMKWYVRKLPDSISVTIGNVALVNYIRGVIGVPTAINGRQAQASRAAVRLANVGNDIRLNLEKAASVSLVVMDARGSVVQRLHSGNLEAGSHAFRLAPAAKGLYWVVLRDARGKDLEVRSLPRL
ncbi:MAG TPA: hypothetical protein VHO02_09555 [Fibrobacteria bacterium]|jgi:hypothetical protein|nr:hypothetical protein [Fibrobacteria bacterium]